MLLQQKAPITHWCYGHFRQSWHSSIDDVLFKMLDKQQICIPKSSFLSIPLFFRVEFLYNSNKNITFAL